MLPECLEDRLMGKGSQAPGAQRSPPIPTAKAQSVSLNRSLQNTGGEKQGAYNIIVSTPPPLLMASLWLRADW